jgi:5,10-methylenetetrahydromethanopterin reductase
MTSFGLSVGVSAREPVRRIGALAERAEDLGFEALWVIDSHLVMGDVYACLAVAGMQTSKIRLGTGVTNPRTRHLTVTANAIASIDDLTDGRAMLGVGSGDSAVQPLGMKAARIAELGEFLADARRLLDGEEIEIADAGVRIARSRPGVPIFLAATQPRMLRLAATVADGIVLLGFADPEVIEWQMGHIARGLEETGRSWDDITIDYWATISVRDDRAQALDDVRSWSAGQARWLNNWKDVPPPLQGFADEARVAAEAYDFGEHLSLRARHTTSVSDEFVRVAAIAGNPDDCRGRLKEISSHPRVSRVTLTLLSGGRTERLETLAKLAEIA